MTVESATYISQLDPSLPADGDSISEGDNVLRMMKGMLQTQFTNLGAAAVTVTAAQINDVPNKSLRAGDTYTGTHAFAGATAVTVPTVTSTDNTTNAASTAMVQAAIASVNAQSPLALSINTGTSVALAVGGHVACTNAATVTATLPLSPAAGDRCRATFTNSLYSNIIDPGSEKIYSTSGTRIVNMANATVEFTYINATVGWVY